MKGNWVLTAFEKKESIARRSTDLPSTQWEAKKTTLANAGNNPTTPPLKNQDFKAKATELYNTAKAQEVEFKEFLENLKSANNSLELGQILKSESSIESKIARKAGDISDINDYLRAAIISKNKAHLDTELVKLEDSLKSRGIKPTIELQHRNASGYKGVHVQFEFNGVPSEIQLHTAKNWDIKKQMDSIYHVLREQEVERTLPYKEIEQLKRKSKALAQGLDLDISDLTSFKVNSPVKGSDKSVLVRRSLEDLKGDQKPPLKSYSKETSSDADIAYNRLESLLNQKESLEGGKGNIEKPLLSSVDSTTPPLKNQDRPYKVITNKEAFIKNLDLSAYATPVPKELDVKAFLKSLEGVENKENFIKHLQAKEDAQSTLAYLNLVEPTLKSPDIKLTKGNRTELIKRFIDENDKFFALPITQDADKKLITFIPKARLKYLQDKIRNADLIQTFNGRAGD
ncbi:hypothetical protein [Helicobacter suis]|uniref:hypothetical protein n=1 Tax=Helicobacter suis TaxID=104628 RepID=UPI0013D35F64|nr:hypothetical protein [Helicobacter suis]